LERRLEGRSGIAIESSPDELDQIQLAAERDWMVSSLDRSTSLLKSARAALERIEDGSFGICEECEGEIHPRRLKAVPWAACCVRCQEQRDQAQTAPSETDLWEAESMAA
ncbi:MAG: TraR/DksA family transcriptional regulator, partial [Bryobacteraceae bacterium]|nr:TraR/DksA family transcriptional regulator [Bryobacteraceae bacterium]